VPLMEGRQKNFLSELRLSPRCLLHSNRIGGRVDQLEDALCNPVQS
jgi:hypothetical protein